MKGWIQLRPNSRHGSRLLDEAAPDLPPVDLVEPIGEVAARGE